MTKIKFLTYIILAVGVFIGPELAQAVMTSGGGYQIWADVVSDGGGEGASSTNYNLSDTIGELADRATSTSGYTGSFGFRQLVNNSLTMTLGSTSINLGTLDDSVESTDSHDITVQTNSPTGLSVTVSGATLTSGANTISAIGPVASPSTSGTEQFGINVAYFSGVIPLASAVAPYNTGDYAYNTGDEIIDSTGEINSTVFDINYVANIDSTTDEGNYSTTLTYTATANF